jgi:phosphoenolpyruvate---glycerone phosphotransferase subunit DhaL
LRVLERAVTFEESFTAADLRRAAVAIAANIRSAAEEINRQDGRLGDGDLGITVSAGWNAVADIAESFPDDIGQSFLASAKAFQRVSSSSFGTMAASAFMAVAKRTQGRTRVPWTEIPELIAAARDAMIARGKGSLGDKTVLDSLDAVRAALIGLDRPSTMRAAAVSAAEKALDDFRDRPNRLGRARMYGERSVGLDDPGMLAFSRILSSLPEAG